MSKKIFCLLIALLMVLTVSCVSAAEDTNDTVAAVDEQVAVQKTIDDVQLESNDNDSDVLSAGTEDPNFNIRPSCSDYGDVSFWAGTEKDATGTVHVKFILLLPYDVEDIKVDEDLTLKDGSVSWGGEGTFLPKGSYRVEATYSGDAKYKSDTIKTPNEGPDAFNVPKILINLTYTSLTVNEKGNIVVNAQLDDENTKDTPYVVQFYNKDNGKTDTFFRQPVLDKGIIVNEKAPSIGGGEYKVSIWYVGDDRYFPTRTQAKYINVSDISINKTTIVLGVGDETDSGASLDPADAGNLTFTSSNESVVKVNATTGVITAVDFGDANVTVSCAGNDRYGPAVNKTISVSVRKPANITVDPAEVALDLGRNCTLNATLNPEDAGNLTFVSSNESVVTVNATTGVIIAVGEGNANITVSFAGSDEYAPCDVVVPVTVSLYDASVIVNNSTLNLFVDETFTIVATTEPEGLKVTYVPDNSGVISVDENGNVTALKEGNASVIVKVGGDGVFAENSTTVTVTVSKVPTRINVANSTVDMKVGDSVNVNATLTPADAGNLTFVSSNSSVVAVDKNGNVKAVAVGEANITVSFAGDDKYAAADNKTIAVTVTLKDASVSVNNSTLDLFVDDTFTIVATTNPAGLNVTYVPDNSGVVSVDKNGKVTAVKAGNAVITVKVGDGKEYAENSTTVTVTVSKVPTEIKINSPTGEMSVGAMGHVAAELIPSEAGNLTYVSNDTNVATVSSTGVIMANNAGTALITVSFAGDNRYAAADNKTIAVTVSLKDASVSVNNSTLDLFVDDTFTIVATTNPAGLNVTYVPDNSGVVSVDKNGKVTAVKAGNAVITVKVGDGKEYAENSTTVKVTVSKVPTEIKINSPTGEMSVGAMGHVAAELIPSEAGNLTYVSNDTNVATVSSTGVIMANNAGTALITVSFAGTDKYAADNKTITLTVNLNDASVSVNNSTLDLFVDDTFTIVATTNPSNLNVTYVPDKSGVVSVDKNGKVTALKTGKAVITVKIAPNGVFAENSTTVTVNVKGIPTEITASAVTTVYNVNKYLVITLKDDSGNAISGAKIVVNLNGAKTYTTDKNGQVKVSTKGLAPKLYTAKITFDGDAKYGKSAKSVNVNVKKATAKMIIHQRIYNTNVKVKLFGTVLRDNTGKAIKNTKLRLRVGGVDYYATTNAKGMAVFKINKLNKVGNFKAAVAYKGNSYYNKMTKTSKIKVILAFKTISKGSKNSVMVKKIQKALKKNGFYLKNRGYTLPIDGIYWDQTVKAVKQFQKAKGLKVTGKVDEKTAKKLGII